MLKVVHEGQLQEKFEVRTGVRQGCLLSPFLLLLAIAWIMISVTNQKINETQWTLWYRLDDLDFADNLALLSHNYQQMQEKTSDLHHASVPEGLKLNKQKTKILRIMQAHQEELEEVESFTHLGSVVDKQGGTDTDMKTRIGKAQPAFNTLKNVWSFGEIGTPTNSGTSSFLRVIICLLVHRFKICFFFQ